METKRFEALDGWRGLAALAIAFTTRRSPTRLREFAGWKNWELFVDFFFVCRVRDHACLGFAAG